MAKSESAQIVEFLLRQRTGRNLVKDGSETVKMVRDGKGKRVLFLREDEDPKYLGKRDAVKEIDRLKADGYALNKAIE